MIDGSNATMVGAAVVNAGVSPRSRDSAAVKGQWPRLQEPRDPAGTSACLRHRHAAWGGEVRLPTVNHDICVVSIIIPLALSSNAYPSFVGTGVWGMLGLQLMREWYTTTRSAVSIRTAVHVVECTGSIGTL